MFTQAADNAPSSNQFFDLRANDYDQAYGQETPGGYALRIRREKVLAMLERPGEKVLDVGCGPGVMAQAIVDRGCLFWGVDASRKMLEICGNRFQGVQEMKFSHGDAANLLFPDETFDSVLCMGVIDAVDERPQAIRQMLRVLKPGGSLLITFTNAFSPYALWKKNVFYPAVTQARKLLGEHRFISAAPPPSRSGRALYTRAAACELIEFEGARIEQAVGYYYNLFLSPLDELFPRLALAATRTLEEAKWPRPEWMALGWIVRATKTEQNRAAD